MSVTYNYDIGKVYDTALFITMYFREDDFISLQCDNVGDEAVVKKFMCAFKEFKECYKHINLPLEIEPFVYTNYDEGLGSFLINLIYNSAPFDDNNKDAILLFLSDAMRVRKRFWRHFFPKTDVSIAKQIAKNDPALDIPIVISKLGVLDDTKLRLVDMARDFEKYQQKLIDAFKLVYPLIDELHEANKNIFNEIKAQLTDKMVTRIRDVYKISETVFSVPVYFSVLNEILLIHRYWDDEFYIGLGQHFIRTLEHRYSNDHISLNSYSRVMGSKVRMQIRELFDNYECLCASEIADLLSMDKPAIYPHIAAMFQEGIIYRTNPEETGNGVRKYFALNMGYYDVLIAAIKKAKNKSSEKIAKGRKRHEVKRKPRKAKDGLIYNKDDEYDDE